jgi:farnesyl diphosphate synthase
MTESMARSDALTKGVEPEAVFQDRLGRIAHDTQALLDRLLGASPVEGERARPARLIEAMRYASLGGGKRLRPFLVVEAAALFGVSRAHALMAGAALECVHCYSLAHDDLPAMDNDDLRRGRPTTHRAFDEATAVLAGDGLLTLAFDILSRPETHPDIEVRLSLVTGLARAAGLGGMVGGQMLDLAAEGRFDAVPPRLDEQEVKTLQAMKTGALLRFGCVAGAILGKANRSQWSALDRYGSALGEAFQIADDLLDVEGDPATVGKATRKDAAAHKASLSTGTVAVRLNFPSTGSLVPNADVFLLFDDTGSFAGTAPAVISQFQTIIDQVQAALPNVHFGFGVGRFEDYANLNAGPLDRPFLLNQPIITTDQAGFQDAITGALARQAFGSGGDTPESLIEALFQTATGLGFDVDMLFAVRSAVADAHAEYQLYATGTVPGSYPQPASAYVYAASQVRVIGPS